MYGQKGRAGVERGGGCGDGGWEPWRVSRPLYIDKDGVVHDWVPIFFVSFIVIAGSA